MVRKRRDRSEGIEIPVVLCCVVGSLLRPLQAFTYFIHILVNTGPFLIMPGRDLEHPFVAPILSRLPNDVDFRMEEGGAVLTVADNGGEATYSAVELVAMVLGSAQVAFDFTFGLLFRIAEFFGVFFNFLPK